jgi:hypothetical protein
MGEILVFLLEIILVLYIVKSVARIFLPFLFEKVVNKAQQQANQQHNYQNNPPSDKIKVDYIPQQGKNTVPDSIGEFVDYEEVK